MLIQSSLIIAGEVGIIIASGLGLAPTSSVGKKEGREGEGEKEQGKERKHRRRITGGEELD